MENIKKENIFKRIFNSIKAGWDRMGQIDVEDEELEMPDELVKPIKAESILAPKKSKESSTWSVEEYDNTENIESRSPRRTIEHSTSKEDYEIGG